MIIVLSACSEYIRAEINFIKPKLIISFGNEAMSLVSPYGSSGVSKHVGEVLKSPKGIIGDISCWVGIMNHPSSALRSSKGESDFQYGTLKIKEFLDLRRKS